MSVEGVLAAGRSAALRLMRDVCLVERMTGRVLNKVTNDYDDVWTPVYTGRCRVKLTSPGLDVDLQVQSLTLHRYEVRLPWDSSPEIMRADRLTITASDDQWLIGRPLEVVDVGLSGTSTARRVIVEDRA